MANYLESYAARFALPVRPGIRVDGLSRHGSQYVVTAGDRRFEAEHVVVAMARYQLPKAPRFAQELDPEIVQLHSLDYRNPGQLRTEAFSSWGPATRAPRSRLRLRAVTARGCPGGARATSRSASEGSRRGCSYSGSSSGSCFTGC